MKINSCQKELDQVFKRFAESKVEPPLPVEANRGELTQADYNLCVRIAKSQQGEKYKRLFSGQLEEYGSQSEADLALCNILAFWSGVDTGQMDRIFRQSKLFRPKWDEKHGLLTYGQMTIQKAIAGADRITESKAFSDEEWFFLALENSSAGRFIDNDPPFLDWVFVESLLAKTVGLLVGPGSVGKSTLMLHLMIAVATGKPILNDVLRPYKQGKVLAIFAEEDETVLHNRFAGLMDGLLLRDDETRQLLKENLQMIAAAGHDLRMLVKSPTGERSTAFFSIVLESMKKISGLRLIVFDPLARFFGAEENDNGAGTFFISLLEQIAQSTGAAVLVCHHVGKRSSLSSGEFNLEAAMHQDSARGASAITNGARWQCNLSGLPAKAVKKHLNLKEANPGQFLALQVSKKNYGPPEPVHFLERQHGGVLRPYIVDTGNSDHDLDVEIMKLVVNAIRKADQDGKKFTKKMILDGFVAEWKKNNSMITRSAVERTIVSAVLKSSLFERNGKNASNRSIIYMSLSPETNTELADHKAEEEPGELEPEEMETTGNSDLPKLNQLNLHIK